MLKIGDILKNTWTGNEGKIIGIEEDVIYLELDIPEDWVDGMSGVEIVLLSDIREGIFSTV